MLKSLSNFLPDARIGASNTPTVQNHPGAPGVQKITGYQPKLTVKIALLLRNAPISKSKQENLLMPINAKILDINGRVTSILLPEAPSDLELLQALGGNQDDLISRLGSLAGYDAIRVNGRNDTLIVGSAPYMLNGSRERVSCNWSDSKIVKFIDHLENGYREFGFA